MNKYLVIQRLYKTFEDDDPSLNFFNGQALFIKSYSNKICALQKMEKIIGTALLFKNGKAPHGFPNLVNGSTNLVNDFPIISTNKEHSDDSNLWSKLPSNIYFVTRDSNEFDKLVVREKYNIRGVIYDSWSTRKIFSVEIVTNDKFKEQSSFANLLPIMFEGLDIRKEEEEDIKFELIEEHKELMKELLDKLI